MPRLVSCSLAAALIACCIFVGPPAACAQQAESWDATWAGGWDNGNGTQIVIAGNQAIGFYWHDDYKTIVESHAAADGRTFTFTWQGGEVVLTRLGGKSARALIREQGQPDIVIDLKSD